MINGMEFALILKHKNLVLQVPGLFDIGFFRSI